VGLFVARRRAMQKASAGIYCITVPCVIAQRATSPKHQLNSTCDIFISMSSIKAALAAIELLEGEELVSKLSGCM
jgi:hypothetical protein